MTGLFLTLAGVTLLFSQAQANGTLDLIAHKAVRLCKCRRTICFVSKEDFVHTPEGRESLSAHFGIDQVIWPEAQLADAIERIIMAPGSVDAAVFAGGQIRLLEFRLGADSPLVGRPVAALALPYGVLDGDHDRPRRQRRCARSFSKATVPTWVCSRARRSAAAMCWCR